MGNRWKLLCCRTLSGIIILSLFTVAAAAAATELSVFNESFEHSTLNLNWLPFPGFSQNPLTPILDPTTPEGDLWAGRQTNEQLGGFASLSYSGTSKLKNYTMEAWVYTMVVPDEKAPLNGIAVRVDPENGRFYRLASHFNKSERRVTFAYVGNDTHNYPVYLSSWEGDEIPGGAPKASSWHKMAIRCVDNRFWAYWDGKELRGCPIEDDRIPEGFFGVYATYVGGKGVVETRVDGIKVTQEEEHMKRNKPGDKQQKQGHRREEGTDGISRVL